KVIMYGDKITDSMKKAIDETTRRRKIQSEYNQKYNITPKSVSKEIRDIIEREYHDDPDLTAFVADYKNKYRLNSLTDLESFRTKLREEMISAADALDFEKAALLRDQMMEIERKIELLKKSK
ncbi:MAG TPA: UvrB/UvrC motif-containing protein, partial [Spirochaetota bacterium]|nr:UvrB/UvrC motif-containing protein [Spirochaetota bacterium]